MPLIDVYPTGAVKPDWPTFAPEELLDETVPYIQRIAEEPLGGHRIVKLTGAGAALADNTDAASRWTSVGLTVAAVDQGALSPIQIIGPIEENSWNWVPNQPVFLGSNGVPTQVVPTSPSFQRIIGVAVTPTLLYIDPYPAVTLV